MQPGPIQVYKCPNCGNKVMNGTIASGNTFGSILYSDGKNVSPNFPDSPDIAKCSKCDTIFWLRKANEFEMVNYFNPIIQKFKAEDKARFFTLYEYVGALDSTIIKSKVDERDIRSAIWWRFNDRVRKGEPLFTSEKDKEIWENNTKRLIELLDITDIDQKISIAELNRNLGNFEKCLEILNSIEIPKHGWLKEKFKKACHKKQKEVFVLNSQ